MKEKITRASLLIIMEKNLKIIEHRLGCTKQALKEIRDYKGGYYDSHESEIDILRDIIFDLRSIAIRALKKLKK